MRPRLLLLPLAAALAFLILSPALSQDQSYHAFADQRTFAGIPNFWNVISNLPFALVGWIGLRQARTASERVLFAGIFLTAFGSAYYHWSPNDARLVWDRLPMTLVFMSLISMLFAPRWLWPLLAFGIGSVLWWILTGDLRLYAVTQFGSSLVILLAMLTMPPWRGIWPVPVFYGLAKLAEYYDQALYRVLPVSGHTLKHLLAAGASFFILRFLRELTPPRNTGSPFHKAELSALR